MEGLGQCGSGGRELRGERSDGPGNGKDKPGGCGRGVGLGCVNFPGRTGVGSCRAGKKV